MPPDAEDMENLDRPATKRDLAALPTKQDLEAFPTKQDLEAFATKQDLEAFATKQDRDALALACDIDALRAETHRHFDAFRTEMKGEFAAFRAEMKRYVDVVIENFKTEFANLYDRTVVTTDSLGRRVGHLETDHGGRLLSLETRVARVEKRRK